MEDNKIKQNNSNNQEMNNEYEEETMAKMFINSLAEKANGNEMTSTGEKVFQLSESSKEV